MPLPFDPGAGASGAGMAPGADPGRGAALAFWPGAAAGMGSGLPWAIARAAARRAWAAGLN